MKKKIIFRISCLVALIISIVGLRTNKYFENLSLYSKPTCFTDGHIIVDGKCPECEKDVTEVGSFIKKHINEYDKKVDKEKYNGESFSKFYKSWNAYIKDYRIMCIYVIFFGISIVCLVLSFIVRFKSDPKR